MSAILTAGQIDDADDLTFVDESVPEWRDAEGKPGVIRLRQFHASEGMELSAEMADPNNVRLGMFLIIIYCAVDGDNNRLYPTPARTDPTYKDVVEGYISRLKRKNMQVLNRLQKICLKLNGMTPDEQVTLKKDSSETEIAGSPTVSLAV